MLPATIDPKSEVVIVQGDCEDNVSEVKVLFVAFHISCAILDAEVKVLDAYDQIVAGKEEIAEASEVEAEFVFTFMEVIAPDTSLSTFELIAVCAPVICDPIELEAVLTVFVVFAFTADVPALIDEAKEVDADWTSESVAKEPEDSDAEVRVLPPKLQMSEADGTEPRLMSVIARSRFVEI